MYGRRTGADRPVSTLDIGRDGTRVATLIADDRIAFKTITIGRDFGTTVEITAGLIVTICLWTIPC